MKICKNCGHPRRVHQPQSENYDAPLECEHVEDGVFCDCKEYEDQDEDPD